MNRKFHIKRAEKALENAEFHRIDGEAWAAMYWLSKPDIFEATYEQETEAGRLY